MSKTTDIVELGIRFARDEKAKRNQGHFLPWAARQQKTLREETTPMDLHHPIVRELPEHREVIRSLKNDTQFRKWFEEYHVLDDAICRIEEEIDFATDQEFEEMRWRRAWLKDRIYSAIRHASAPVTMAAPSPQLSASA